MMTDILDLFTGIGIVIDDALERKDQKDDLIWKITENIESKNIPLLPYFDLPEEGICKQFKNINFVLLDWELFEKPEPGLRIDTNPFITANISFIKRITEVTFVPIFIFSNEQPETIITHLIVAGLYVEGKKNNIFVKQKSDLIAEDNNNLLFEEIERWVKETPSIYVLKEWEVSLNTAKRNLFHGFYNLHHEWPLALAKAFNLDGVDMDYELGGFIYRNLSARAIPVQFDDAIITKEDFWVDKNELRKILEGERFIINDLPDHPFPGDIFKEVYEEGGVERERYFINIRAACDTARQDNPELYFLKGRIIDENKINSNEQDSIIFKRGSFIERVDLTYVPFINGKIFEFLFKELKIKKWDSCKQYRLGRLLPPYITKIQQKYSFYIQRQGLPGIPHEAIE